MAVSIGSAASWTSGSLLAPRATFSKTVPPGANLLVVLVSLRDDASAIGACTTCTYGGLALTRLAGKNNAANELRAEIWYLKNPPAGTADVVVANKANYYTVAGAVDVSGVDGSAPFGVPVYALSNGGASAAVSVPALAGEIVLDILAKEGSAEDASAGTGQQQLYYGKTSESSTLANVIGCSSWQSSPSGGSVAMSWSWLSASRPYVQIGVALKAPASGSTIALLPVSDTFLSSGGTSTNYSTNVQLATGKSTNTFRSLLKFDFGALAGKRIRSAKLRLCVNSVSGTSANVTGVYRCLRDWVDSQATWNVWKTGSSWSSAGAWNELDVDMTALGSAAIGTSVGAWYEIPLDVSIVEQIASGALPNCGFYLKADTEGTNQRSFRSRDYTPAGSEPQLAVETANSLPIRVCWWS